MIETNSNEILNDIYLQLDIDEILLANYRLERCEQAPIADLEVVDIDFEGKPFVLVKSAATAWRKMSKSAQFDHIKLEPFSGFRSYVHQQRLIARGLERGRTMEEILRSVALPGYSEHHTGRAVDICTEGKYELTEAFEQTKAFAWLIANANRFDFRLSYPISNSKGIIYEPWHWFFEG